MTDTYLSCLFLAIAVSLLHMVVAWYSFPKYREAIQNTVNQFPTTFYIVLLCMWTISGAVIYYSPLYVWIPLYVVSEGYSLTRLVQTR